MTSTTQLPTHPVAPTRGSQHLHTALQQVLANLLDLQAQAKHLHWNVTGAGFRSVHALLDDVANEARNLADRTAERDRAVGGAPDGRSEAAAATSTLAEAPVGVQSAKDAVTHIVTALREAAATARASHDPIDAEDPPTGDVLNLVIETLEHLTWMAQAELD